MGRLLMVLVVVGLALLAIVLATRPPEAPDALDDGDRIGRSAGENSREDPGEVGGSAALITGTIWRGGSPVAARVELLAVSTGGVTADPLASLEGTGSPLLATQARGGGAFRFRGLAVGTYEVRATTQDGATGWSLVRIRFAGERVLTEVAVPDGAHALRGRTVHADGRPFLGRVTIVRIGNGQPGAYRATRTDDEGRFVVAGLEPGRCVPTRSSTARSGTWIAWCGSPTTTNSSSSSTPDASGSRVASSPRTADRPSRARR